MTLRLALLLAGLIILAVIGFYCHIKYQSKPQKRRASELANQIDSDAELNQQLNTPYFNENIDSGAIAEPESILSIEPIESDSQAPQLTTSLEDLTDKRKLDGQIAMSLLPKYQDHDLITHDVAVIANINRSAKQLTKLIDQFQTKLKWQPEIRVALKKSKTFVALDQADDKDQIRHLQAELPFKAGNKYVDPGQLQSFRRFIKKFAEEVDCEYRFALAQEQLDPTIGNLKSFVERNDQIIIAYILAQPDNAFAGSDLAEAAAQHQLEHGEFGFYHYASNQPENLSQKVFSLANLYKPGSFDLDALDDFSTTGLCVFMVPSLLADPVAGFNEMLHCAEQLAVTLNGVLTNEKRQALSKDMAQVIINNITEQQQKLLDAGVEPGSVLAKTLFS